MKIYGTVKNGRLGLSEDEKRLYNEAVIAMEGKPYLLEFKAPDRVKTASQLRYLYGVVYKTIKDYLKTVGVNVKTDDLHSIYANEWLTKDILIGGRIHSVPIRLSTATVDQVRDFIDTVVRTVACPPKTKDTPDGEKFGLGLAINDPM